MRWFRRGVAVHGEDRPTAMVFAPYLHTLGGGERVIVRITRLLQRHHEVRLCAPRPRDEKRWASLGFPEIPITVMNARQFTRASWRKPLVVAMTNHLPLPSLAKDSILIVQFPTDDIRTMSAWRRTSRRWAVGKYRIVTYSQFNATHIYERWRVRDVTVLPPPVQQFSYDPGAKTRTILSVGRFTTSGNHKRHDVLLEAWAALRPRLPGWELVLVGAGGDGDPYLGNLKIRASEIGGVTIHVDAPPSVLDECYRQASIYWHAAGYGRAADRPDMAEHFGMSTVEAMSAGGVPIVFCDGGQVDIVAGTAGFCWHDVPELVAMTESLAIDPRKLTAGAIDVSAAAQRFAPERFDDGFLRLVTVSP